MNDENQYKNTSVQLIDHTTLYKPYGVSKRLSTLMGIIPNADLEGLSAIHTYDDSFPEEITGKYYPAGVRDQFSEIEIYLNQTFGHLALVSDEKCRFQTVRNRLFLSTFGMMFLAESLFHEIGHHKFMGVDLKEYKTSTDQETDAKNYADQLLRKAFPCFLLCYPFTNMIYHLLFRKFIKKSNKFAQSKTIVDPGYFRSAGKMYLAEEGYKKAVEAFSRAIETDPCDCYAYFGRGVAMHQLGKHREAILDYTSGIEIYHSDPIAFYNRGLSYRAIKEYEKAVSDFTQAMKLDYRDKDVYLNRAFCYSELGNKQMAESDLREIGGTGQRESPKGQGEATGVKVEPKGTGLNNQQG